MKANQLFDKILDKWPVKVCCLIIAISLYLFHQASLTEKRSFVIPLQLIEEGAVMHTGDYTSNVTVVIRANTEQISSIHTNEIQAFVNLNSLAKSGEYTLPVKVKVTDEIMSFDPFEIKVKPEYIKIKVEPKDLKYIPLEASVVGEPAHGYEIKSVSIEPSELEVTGPLSIIENTNKIYTEKIDVEGLTKNETFEVAYKTLNKLLSVKETEPLQVTVNIEPAIMERTIENIVVNVTGLNEKFFLENDIPDVSVTLQGTVPVLENYSPGKRFVSLDLQSIKEEGEYDLPLNYNIPSYFGLLETSMDTVHIVVLPHQNENEQEEQEMEAVQ